MNGIIQLLARLPVLLAMSLILLYRLLLSPVLHAFAGPGSGCRHTPTCSAYALEALRLHGFWRGLVLSTWRLARCHPWGHGGADPVPQKGRWRDAFRRTGAETSSSDCPLHG